jgi:hypothetical protein
MISLRIVDQGIIDVAAGELFLMKSVSGGGLLKIDAGATLNVGASVARSLSLDFNGPGATLALSQPAKFGAMIEGFVASDTIDLIGITATDAKLDAADHLVVVNGSTIVARLRLSGNYNGDSFTVEPDGHGGTNISVVGAATRPHAFIAAMASLAPRAEATMTPVPLNGAWCPTLAAPPV